MNTNRLYSRRLIGLLFVFSSCVAWAQIKPSEKDALLQDSSYRSLETLARGLFYLESMYVDPTKVSSDQLVASALKGIVDKLDPHTMIMPKEAFRQLTIDTQGKFGGIGIIVSQEHGKLIVVQPIEGTPASKAGIKPGDEIISIDGHEVKNDKSSDAVNRMQGEPGSKVSLAIRRDGSKQLIDLTLVREVIKVKSVRGMALSSNVHYVRITSFQEDTTTELDEILKKQAKTMRGLVLDLRDNPGGLLDQAVRVSDLFIDSGLIVSTVGRDESRVEREFAHRRNTYAQIPMVTLVNGGSASASEIVAGALQDHQRSLILGSTTFGKGSVQTLVSLPDGSGLKLTVARYYTPNDRSIQARGIAPDVVVANTKKVKKEPVVEEKPTKGKRGTRKESDLKGHIEAKDLSDMANKPSMLKDYASWPAPFREDKQLLAAYSYLKSYRVFRRKTKKSRDPAERK